MSRQNGLFIIDGGYEYRGEVFINSFYSISPDKGLFTAQYTVTATSSNMLTVRVKVVSNNKSTFPEYTTHSTLTDINFATYVVNSIQTAVEQFIYSLKIGYNLDKVKYILVEDRLKVILQRILLNEKSYAKLLYSDRSKNPILVFSTFKVTYSEDDCLVSVIPKDKPKDERVFSIREASSFEDFITLLGEEVGQMVYLEGNNDYNVQGIAPVLFRKTDLDSIRFFYNHVTSLQSARHIVIDDMPTVSTLHV